MLLRGKDDALQQRIPGTGLPPLDFSAYDRDAAGADRREPKGRAAHAA